MHFQLFAEGAGFAHEHAAALAQETVPVQASITLVPPPPLGQWRCCQGGQHRHASREYGLSEPTFYSWKSEFQDMSVSELQRLKHLEDENRCLKQLYAELSLEHQVTKEVLRKKQPSPRPGAK